MYELCHVYVCMCVRCRKVEWNDLRVGRSWVWNPMTSTVMKYCVYMTILGDSYLHYISIWHHLGPISMNLHHAYAPTKISWYFPQKLLIRFTSLFTWKYFLTLCSKLLYNLPDLFSQSENWGKTELTPFQKCQTALVEAKAHTHSWNVNQHPFHWSKPMEI